MHGFRRVGAYLRHDAIGSSSLLVLEDDVGVVAGVELFEPLLVRPLHRLLAQPARSQRVLRHVRHVLLEDERRHLTGTSAPARAAPGTAGGDGEGE